MSAEIRKSTVKLNRNVYEGSGRTVCQADIIVPDTMPDCLKVLQAEGNAVTESRIITKGKISVRGRVECEILYVPENAGGVRCITNSVPFAYSENVAEAEEKMFFETQSRVSHIEFQLANSRKVNVKAVVETQGKVTENREIQYVSAAVGDDAEVITQKFSGKNRVVCKNADFEISESVQMPSDAETIVKTCAQIRNSNVKIINNKIVAKGEIGVNIMYKAEGEKLDVASASVPFTEILDAEGISDGQYTNIEYRLTEVSARIAESENGKEARYVFGVEVSITADETVEFEGITDIYGTEKMLLPQRETFETEGNIKNATVKVDVREIVKLEEDAPPAAKVFAVQAKGYVNECIETANGVKVSGEARCVLTYISEKEEQAVYTAMFDLPFTATVNMDRCANYIAEIKAENGECTINGYDAELSIPLEIAVTGSNTLRAELVTEVDEKECDAANRPAMTLYFVQKGDTMWEIAKRYQSKIGDIERINKVDGDQINEGMMLLIPKK